VIINYFSGAKSNNTAGNIAKQRCYVSKQIKKHKIPMANSKPKIQMENENEEIIEVSFIMKANVDRRGSCSRHNLIEINYGDPVIYKKRRVSKLLPTKVTIDKFEKSETGLPEGWITLHGKCSVLVNKDQDIIHTQFYEYGSNPSIRGFYKYFKGVFGPDAPRYREALKVEIQGDIRLYLIRNMYGMGTCTLSDDLFSMPD
jgi:hypothetical protein